MSAAALNALFQPFEGAGLSLPNRVVMAPMSRYQSPDDIPTEQAVEYYSSRARGGVGLVITEGSYIAHPSAASYEHVSRCFGDDAVAAWRPVVDAVHAAGSSMMAQLWHVGSFRQTGMGPDPEVPGISPSGILNEYAKNTIPPRIATPADLAALCDAYAESARAAVAAGFDGVELHGAHGYVLDEFLWHETNRRDDAYGGSLERRLRFVVEVVSAVRAALGPDHTLGLRLSQWKQQDFEARLVDSPAELAQLIEPLVEAGVDLLHGSTRRYWEPAFEDSPLNFAGWLRKLSGLPAITVGSVGLDSTSFRAASVASLDQLMERLERAEFDLVAVGRALLADADWALKVQQGRADEIDPFTAEAIARYP